MKRIIVIALACALAPLASAQLYKSVGPDGKVTYTDQPPAGVDSKQINVQQNSAPAPKTAMEKDKEAEKLRAESREKAKKGTEDAKVTQANEARCVQAKAEYQLYLDGGRLARTNAKGEREELNDAQIEAERARSRGVMEEACKK